MSASIPSAHPHRLAVIVGREFRFDLSHFGLGSHPVSHLLAGFSECVKAPVVERVQLSIHFDQPYRRDGRFNATTLASLNSAAPKPVTFFESPNPVRYSFMSPT